MSKEFDLSVVGNDCLAESHRILNCYVRYMYKKFKLYRFNYYSFIYSPRYAEYSNHITSILLLSRRYSFKGLKSVLHSPSKCKEIDLLVKKFVKNKYGLKLEYSEKYKTKKNNYYQPFKIKFLTIFRDILLDLREIKYGKEKITFIQDKTFSKEHFLILSHKVLGNSNKGPYNNLPKKLGRILTQNKIDYTHILPNQIGLNFFEKLESFLEIALFTISRLIRYKKFSLTNIHFIFYISYTRLYKNKLKKFFLSRKITSIICSYIDIRYEPSYFNAAKELNLKYYLYDYSVGYPLKELRFLRYLPDTRKYSKVVFFNSEFRKNQYEKANFLNAKAPLLLPHTCPQYDFSINQKIKFNNLKDTFKIGIVDNIFSDDLILNYLDIHTLVKHLVDSEFKLEFILQSKRGKLLDFFNELNFVYKDYQNFQKGDFSLLSNTDLILSIGWQGTALKASSAFNKPLLFYSQKGYPYKNHLYFLDKEKNEKINYYCESLWSNQNNFPFKLRKIIEDNNYFEYIKQQSKKMIDIIGFKNDDIENYLKLFLNSKI